MNEDSKSGQLIEQVDKQNDLTVRQVPDNKTRTKKKIIAAVVCFALALISFVFVAPKFENINAYPGVAKSLDDKRISVMEVSAALAGVSVAIAAVPGDSTTPIADNIAQYSSYLVIVLGAIMLEKFLLPVLGLITLRILIPLALVLLGIFILYRKRILFAFSIRAALLGIALISIIPIGIKVGDLVDDSFGLDAAIERIKTGSEEIDNESESAEDTEETDEEESSGLWDTIVNTGKNIIGSVTGFGSRLWEKVKLILGEVMDVIAAFIVSSCVIPIGILFILLAIVKGVSGAILKYTPFGSKDNGDNQFLSGKNGLKRIEAKE